MPSTLYDVGYLKAGTESLEEYLISRNIFWPIHSPSPSGQSDYPRLTLGNLLLSKKRLDARDLTYRQVNLIKSLFDSIEVIHIKRRDAWMRKANNELKSRLRQWNYYLKDLRENPEVHEVFYTYEVKVRVIIDLLIPETDRQKPATLDALRDMDAFLHKVFVPGPFLWERDLSHGFDEKEYWYLWGFPKLEEKLLR